MTQQKPAPQNLNFLKNKPLSEHCTFGIGGEAHYFCEVRTADEMREALLFCNKQGLKFFVLGKGSNCLFDDKGFSGMVILNKIDQVEELSEGLFYAGAGSSFSLLGTRTAKQGWAGLEFASGIPGSVGGAVFMNAGANGRETCDSLHSVEFMDPQGNLTTLLRSELHFSYRHSPFQDMPGAIVGATFLLERSEVARQKQIEIITYRKKTQPYGDKSAGCVFRNPDCGYAGQLIEKCGLKAASAGGAEVSSMHANFIVNRSSATAADVRALIEHVRSTVKGQTGIELLSEVRIIPYE